MTNNDDVEENMDGDEENENSPGVLDNTTNQLFFSNSTNNQKSIYSNFSNSKNNNNNCKESNFYLQADSYDANLSCNKNLEYVPSSDFNMYKSNYNNNFHNNYQTYRFECSKLMSNDAYEPPITPTNFDLRNLLKAKSSNQRDSSPEKYSPKCIRSNDEQQKDCDHLEDLDYSLPITQPINISNEIYMNKRNKMYPRKNDYANKRAYPNKSNYSNDKYENSPLRKINNNSRGHDETSDKEFFSERNKEESENSEPNNECKNDDVDEDEDEDDLSYKKMRSVVAKAIVSSDKRKMLFYLKKGDSARITSRKFQFILHMHFYHKN